ncbi:MAG: VOC family protein [Chthonomonas sp.]|nr:VOC family protein [Chthonomonas sp.]
MEQAFPTLTPYIVVGNAKEALAFYTKALGAEVVNVAYVPNTEQVMNAQMRVGDSMLMLNDEFPDWGVFAPKAGENMPCTIHITSHNIDAEFQRAIDAGATVCQPLEDMFWGDRYGSFMCPFGYKWSMGQKIKDVSPEEMAAAMQAMGG